MNAANAKVDINDYDPAVSDDSAMSYDTKLEKENTNRPINACTRPPKDETFKQKMARLVRDADNGNHCVSCGGDRMAIVNAADKIIEWIVTKFKKN